jgi:hypothetical protein
MPILSLFLVPPERLISKTQPPRACDLINKYQKLQTLTAFVTHYSIFRLRDNEPHHKPRPMRGNLPIFKSWGFAPFVTAILSAALVTMATAVLTGCASSPKSSNAPRAKAIGKMLEHEVGDIDQEIVERIVASPPPRGKKTTQAELDMHRKVWWWLHYYSVRDRARFIRNLERGERYRPMVQQVLREHHLPPELYYLALIESGFVTSANSTANAIGIWQFMKPTALQYGLGVHSHYDERKNPIAATHAAARYLSDLHDQFGSWYLAIAAYNAGQGRIKKAVQRARTTDFWKLVERRMIPQETMDYIPKFLAAATIGQHLDTFGFDIRSNGPQWPELSPVRLSVRDLKKFKSGHRARDLARLAGLPESELLRFNPQLKQKLKVLQSKTITMWLPKESAERFKKQGSWVVAKEAPIFRGSRATL